MNSDGFYVPLTKYEFGDAERSILENLNKKHWQEYSEPYSKFSEWYKNQFKDSDHSGKTQFSLENNLLR